MKRSESIKEISKAISKSQSEMKPARFDMVNPFFKSKYASYASILEACEPFFKNGISIVQSPTEDHKYMETIFMHDSGEWISGTWPILCQKLDSQTYGSATTYAKRYGLSAMAGISSDVDDDAEMTKVPEIKKPVPVNNQKTVAGNFKPKEAPKPIPNSTAKPKEAYQPSSHFD